jgi:23S rRNA (adenine2503-C2)-methyltransferase
MPVNKLWPLEDIAKSCMDYNSQVSQISRYEASRRVTYEYVMLEGINDTRNHAQALTEFVTQRGMPPAHVNLIHFNKWDGSIHTPSDRTTMLHFERYLHSREVECSIRWSKVREEAGRNRREGSR